eukprot:Sdes_comp18275_c0_seq1m7925
MSQRDPPNSPTRKLTREQKKDVFLREFDLEVQARIERMRVNARTLGYSIRNEFSVELIKLPSKIRKLPMKTFSEIWNSFSTDQIPISTHDFSNHCSNNNNNTNTNNGLKRTNSTTQPTKQDSSSVLFSLKVKSCLFLAFFPNSLLDAFTNTRNRNAILCFRIPASSALFWRISKKTSPLKLARPLLLMKHLWISCEPGRKSTVIHL